MQTLSIYYCFLLNCVVWCEIITLIKDKNVTCVLVEDSDDSPLYLWAGTERTNVYTKRVINPKFFDNVSSANPISFSVPYNEDVRFNIILNDTSKEESLGNKSNANIDTKLCIWIHYTAEIKNEKIEITYVESRTGSRGLFEFCCNDDRKN